MCGIVGAASTVTSSPCSSRACSAWNTAADSCGVAVHAGGLTRALNHLARGRPAHAGARRPRPGQTGIAHAYSRPRTAHRPYTTPTRTSATAPAKGFDSARPARRWRWCATASSRTTRRCAPLQVKATSLRARPTPSHRPPDRQPLRRRPVRGRQGVGGAAGRLRQHHRDLPRRAAPRGGRACGLAAGAGAWAKARTSWPATRWRWPA